jgi:hypothetical protein
LRPLLTITVSAIVSAIVSALALAGCADGYDKSADTDCRHSTPPDRQARWELVTPGVVSLGMDTPTKKLLGLASPNQVDVYRAACLRNQDNKGNGPQIHDLQKIGSILSPGLESRL